jgi:hypothetical protein
MARSSTDRWVRRIQCEPVLELNPAEIVETPPKTYMDFGGASELGARCLMKSTAFVAPSLTDCFAESVASLIFRAHLSFRPFVMETPPL